jgi:hypothetical protein
MNAKASRSRPPFALEGLDHVLLAVDGRERALDFYEHVLGCVLEERYPQWEWRNCVPVQL